MPFIEKSAEAELALALGIARDGNDVDIALEEYCDSMGILLSSVHVGGIENNAPPITAMSDPLNALYERVINGFDALIEFGQDLGQFDDTITTPSMAIEVLKRGTALSTGITEEDDTPVKPGVFVFHTTTGTGKRNATVTVTVGDTGRGIIGRDFPSTILSLNSTNKIRNRLVFGRYNQGGSATFAFSDKTVILSRSRSEPDMLYFTVVARIYPEDCKVPVWVYYTTPEKQVFSCNINEFTDGERVFIDQITKESIHTDAYARMFLPPSHGTVIRHIGYPIASPVDYYMQLRQNGFGIALPVCYMHTNRRNNRYSLHGLRHVLDENNPKSPYPVVHTLERPMAHQLTVRGKSVGYITVQYWVMKRTENASPDKTPTAGRTTDPLHGIYVTVYGHTHQQLPTRVLLRDHFPLLDQYMLIEVACDQVDPRFLGDLVTSGREKLNSAFEETVKQKILATLKADPRIVELHAERRAQLAQESTQTDNTEVIDRINSTLLDNPLAGLLTSTFGAQQHRRVLGEGEQQDVGEGGGGGGYHPPLPPIEQHDPPQTLRLIGKQIVYEKDQEFFVKIFTDAPAPYVDRMKVAFDPPIIRETAAQNSRKLPSNGRGGFWVQVDKSTIDQMVIVRVEMPSGKGVISDEKLYTIVPKQQKPGRQQPVSTMPKVTPILISPSDSKWVEMDAGAVKDPTQVAFRVFHDKANGEAIVWINSEFKSYKRLCDKLLRDKCGFAIKRLTDRYVEQLGYEAITAIEAEMSIEKMFEQLPAGAYHMVKAGNATAMLFTIYRQIDLAKRNGLLDEDDVIMPLMEAAD